MEPATPGATRAVPTHQTKLPLDSSQLAPPSTLPDQTLCKYKFCKRTPKDNEEGATLYRCSIPSCENSVHGACLAQLRDAIGAADEFDETVCGKRCYNAAKKRATAAPSDPNVKKRVSWYTDGPTASINSMTCLLDWMTTGCNYSKYRGGDGQHGEKKGVLAGEISRYINECGVPTVRTAKSIMDKIEWLDDTFKDAARWLNGTGPGVTDESSLREAIL